MGAIESHAKWTLTSSGASTTPFNAMGYAERFTGYITTSEDGTATVQIQSAPESTGPWVGWEASTAIASNTALVQQFAGPLKWVRPFVTAVTASQTVTIELIGN